MIKTQVLLWKTIEGNRRLRVRVRVRGFFYFILNSPPLTYDVTCSVTLLGWKEYQKAMSDEHPPNNGNNNNIVIANHNNKIKIK